MDPGWRSLMCIINFSCYQQTFVKSWLSFWGGIGMKKHLTGSERHFSLPDPRQQERVQLFLSYANLPMIHEVQDWLEVCVLRTLQEGVLVRVLVQEILEEWAAGGRNHFVSLDLLIITSKSHIEEIFIITNAMLMFFSKSFPDIAASLRENVWKIIRYIKIILQISYFKYCRNIS